MTEETEAQLKSCWGGLGANPLMLGFKGGGTSLQSLGGGDRIGCHYGWPWAILLECALPRSETDLKSRRLSWGDILGQEGPSFPPAATIGQGFERGLLSTQDFVKRKKSF